MLVVALAGCGGGGEDDRATEETTSSVADGATEDTTTAPDETTVAPPTEITPACDRFTQAELDSALGRSFGVGTSKDDGDVCTWEADASNQVGLTVRVAGTMSPDVLCDTMATSKSERLEIDGHPAVFEGNQLYVCGEGHSLNLHLNVSLAEGEMRTALIDLATIGTSR